MILITIFIFTSISVRAENSVFDVVICADSTRINPGQNLTFYIYLVGVENVTNDFLLCYVNGDIFFEKITVLGKEYAEGLADKGTNAQLLPLNIAPQIIPDVDYPSGVLHPLWARDANNSAITITIGTTNETPPGDHDLKIIYLYKGQNGVWQSSRDTMTFHVTTKVEQVEWKTLLWNNYFLPLIGFLTALGIFFLGVVTDRYREKKRKNELLKNMLRMIKDEITLNLERTRQIKTNISPSWLPTFRLNTNNKDTCWSKIVDYWDKEIDIISNISKIYNNYELLNRTIEVGFEMGYRGIAPSPPSFVSEINRICDKIEEKSGTILSSI